MGVSIFGKHILLPACLQGLCCLGCDNEQRLRDCFEIKTDWYDVGTFTSLAAMCDAYYQDHPKARAELDREVREYERWIQDNRIFGKALDNKDSILRIRIFQNDPHDKVGPLHSDDSVANRSKPQKVMNVTFSQSLTIGACIYYISVWSRLFGHLDQVPRNDPYQHKGSGSGEVEYIYLYKYYTH